jgi:squalene cyclase
MSANFPRADGVKVNKDSFPQSKALKMKKSIMFAVLSAASIIATSAFADATIDASIKKGAEFLLASQSEDGHWSDAQMPALTALPVWALSGWGQAPGEAVEKGVKFVLGTQREDGGFYVPKPGRGG